MSSAPHVRTRRSRRSRCRATRSTATTRRALVRRSSTSCGRSRPPASCRCGRAARCSPPTSVPPRLRRRRLVAAGRRSGGPRPPAGGARHLGADPRLPRPHDRGGADRARRHRCRARACSTDAAAPELEPDEARWGNLRTVATALSDRDAGLFTEALAIANWHASHTHCPRSGAPTVVEQGGWVRRCPDDGVRDLPAHRSRRHRRRRRRRRPPAARLERHVGEQPLLAARRLRRAGGVARGRRRARDLRGVGRARRRRRATSARSRGRSRRR